MKRIRRAAFGVATVIPPSKPGALAQCALCPWGEFVPHRARSKWSALDRAFARLRAHAKKQHPDTFPKFSTAQEIFG
jgi:hypothetical protein